VLARIVGQKLSAQFSQFLKRDLAKWAQIVKVAGIKAGDS
jgi:hypothetical protein